MSAAAIEESSSTNDLAEENGDEMTTTNLITSTSPSSSATTISTTTTVQATATLGAAAAPVTPAAVAVITTTSSPAAAAASSAAAVVSSGAGGSGVGGGGGGSGGGGGGGVSPPSPHSSIPPSLEQHCRLLEEEVQSLKETLTRVQQQNVESQRRERILLKRLTAKDQEIQDYMAQIAEYKAAQAPGPTSLRSALLDPAVNILFEKLKQELLSTRAKLEETQDELSAWKFTPDSNTGKRLMAKCRLLYLENEELGKMTSNGRLAKLEGELAMQKSFREEFKKSQSELEDFLQELDEDVEAMQSTILFLQQELKAAKDRNQLLESENFQLKNGIIDGSGKTKHLVNGKTSPVDERDISESYESEQRTSKLNFNNYVVHSSLINNSNNNNNINDDDDDDDDEEDDHSLRTKHTSNYYNGNELENINGGEDERPQIETINSSVDCISSSSNSNNNNNTKIVKHSQRKRNYDSDSSENSSNGCTLRSNKKLKKKARRSSVLSIDLNEEDTQIAGESDEEETNQRVVTRRKSARNHQNGDHN